MPPKKSSSQKSSRPSSSSRRSMLKLDPSLFDSTPPAKKQKLKPLSFSSQEKPKGKAKRQDKGKAPARKETDTNAQKTSIQEGMWVDLYSPMDEEDLAVHVRKVQDVRHWINEAFEGGPSGKLKKYRRILALTGPAGTGKTATLRVLSKEMGFEILEWKNAMDDNRSQDFEWDSQSSTSQPYDIESLMEKFQAFLARAASCRPLFSTPVSGNPLASSQPLSTPSASTSSIHRQVILLEDLPNILHSSTQEAFHAALRAVVDNTSTSVAIPIVIIVSDAGVRGESGTEDGPSNWRGRGRDTIDIRSVLPPGTLNSPFVTQIRFNPIAPTLMRRALQSLVTKQFAGDHNGLRPSKNILDMIVDASNGDIRSAIMALQFACVPAMHATSAQKGGQVRSLSRKSSGIIQGRELLEAVTKREQSLALFHLIGKLLYNKRKGDPPASSASKKDIQRENDVDRGLRDPPKLPPHLRVHERRASRVDVEALYADSPIDSSLLSLYVHQNYTQYCDKIDDCEGVMDLLSWVDANGGEAWYQANPHRFHLVSLGTLHSLPSPVTRRNQKPYKPAFFDALSKEREGQDGARDVQDWLLQNACGRSMGWSQENITLELGAILKLKERSDATQPPPPSHRQFSQLHFTQTAGDQTELADDDNGHGPTDDSTDEGEKGHYYQEPTQGGWLEDDDIEDPDGDI